jgi:hypothetical protein
MRSSGPAPLRWLLRVGGAAAILSCTTDEPTGPLLRVASVTLAGLPVDSVLILDSVTTTSADARSATGVAITGRGVTWFSDNPAIIAITDAGVLHAVGRGSASVRATVDGVERTQLLYVRDGFAAPPAGAPPATTSGLNGDVTLVIPGGAVPSGIVPHVRVAPSPPADSRLIGAWEFGPSGTTFSSPVTLRLRYNPTGMSPVDRAQVRVFGRNGAAWVEMPGGTVDTVTHTASAPLSHFSTYAVFRRGTPVTLVPIGWVGPALYTGSVVSSAPVLVVRDSEMRPVPRVRVQFAVTAGGGALAGGPTEVVTGADGVATLPAPWTLGSEPGTNTVTATLPEHSGPTVNFDATALATPGVVQLALDTLQFSGTAATASPAAVGIAVTNGGQEALIGLTAGPITYGAGASGWLTTAFSGTTAPATLTLTPNISGIKAGSYTARVPVQSATPGSAPDTLQVRLTLAPAPPVRVSVQTPVASVTSGLVAGQQAVIRVEDAFGDVVSGAAVPVTMRLSAVACPGECLASLVGDTVVTSVNGIATFEGIRLDGFGPTAVEYLAPGLTSATQGSVAISQVAAALEIVAEPVAGLEGAVFTTQPVVQILDHAGIRVRGATNTVTATLESGTGSLAGTTAVSAVNGVATFGNLAISAAGTKSLRFTSSAGIAHALSADFAVQSYGRVHLSVDTAQIAAVAAGSAPSAVQVSVSNGGDQVLTGLAAGPVEYVSGAVGGWLAASLGGATTTPATLSLTASTGGMREGVYVARVPVQSTAIGSIPDTLVVVLTLSQAPPIALVASSPLAGLVSGLSAVQQPVVRLEDAFGDAVSGAAVAVTLRRVGVACPTGCEATILGDTVVTSVDGIATFSGIRVDGYGPIAFEFVAAGLPTVGLAAMTVEQVSASLGVVTPMGAAIAGFVAGTQPTVEIRDNAGLRVRAATPTVSVTLAEGSGNLSGTTSVSAIDGIATFAGLAIDLPGSKRLQFASAGLPTVVGDAFVVTTPSAVALSSDSVELVAVAAGNAPAPITVAITNGGESPLTGLELGAPVYVDSAANWLSAVLTGGSNAPSSVELSVNGTGIKAGTYRAFLPVSATSPGAVPDTLHVVLQLSAAPAARLVVDQPLGGVVSGQMAGQQPSLRVEDAFGDLVDAGTLVTVRVDTVGCAAACAATLLGDTTVAAVAGVATFTNLRVDGFGAVGFRFVASALDSAVQAPVDVVQVPTSLVMVSPPAGALESVALGSQPVLQIRDAAGLRVRGNSDAATATLVEGTGSLLGATVVAAVDGAVTFTDLAVDAPGLKRLAFEVNGLPSVESDTFRVLSVIARVALSPDTLRSAASAGRRPSRRRPST